MKERSEWTRRVMADLKAGLEAFGPVKRRRSLGAASAYQSALPFRGVGVRPDGSVTLAAADKYVLVPDLERDPPPTFLGATVLDSIRLTASQWRALAPVKTDAGSAWTVPEAVARQLYPALSVSTNVFRDAADVTTVRLVGKVEAVRAGVAYLKYEGQIAGTHWGTTAEGNAGNKMSSEARLLGGVGRYDVRARRMLSLTLVLDGLSRTWAPYDDPPKRFGAVLEWSLTRPSPASAVSSR
jgi:hypothetical protein